MKKLVQLNLIILLTLSNLYTFAKDCDYVTPEVRLHDSIATNIKLADLVAQATENDDEDEFKNYVDQATFNKFDKRKVKTSSSPSYLDAVGRLKIIDMNDNINYCTAYLVSMTPGASSKQLGSAAHCINEYANTKDVNKIGKFKKKNIKKIIWTTTVDGIYLQRNASVVDYDVENDQLLLDIGSTIPFEKIQPLLVENEVSINPNELIGYGFVKKLVAAGFHADTTKGQGGEVLTYDDQINLKTTAVEDRLNGQSVIPETVTYSGGSGGPLIAEMDLSGEDALENPHNQMYVIGTLYGFSGHTLSQNYLDKNGKTKGTNRPDYRSYVKMSILLDDHK